MKRLKNICTVNGGYIEIPYKPSLNTKVEIKFRPLVDNTLNGGVFGVGNPYFGVRVFNRSGQFQVAIGGNGKTAYVNFSKNTDYTVTMDSSGIDFNGVFYNYDGTPTELTNANNFRINHLNGQVEGVVGLESLIYYCKIYDDGNLVYDLQPCLSDEGVVGMVNELTNVFYEPIGKPFLSFDGYKWETITDNYDRSKRLYAVKWKNSGSFEGFFSEKPNVNADDATWWNYYGENNPEMGYCTENRFDCARKHFSNRFYGFIDEKWESQIHTVKVSDGYIFTFPKEMYWAGKITNYSYAVAGNCFEVLVMDKSLMVEPEEIEFGYKGGTQQINIVSRGEYTYTTDGDFEFTENEEGMLVTAQFNNGDADKVGSVVFTSEDGEVVTVSINQKHMLIPFVVDKYKHYDYNIYKEYRNNSVVKKVMRNNALVYVGPVVKPTLKLEKKEISVFKQGGTIFVGVTSNTQYTATSDADYVSVEVVDGGINIVAEPQTQVSMVTITVTAGNDDIAVTDTITLTYVVQNDNEIWFTTVNNETPYRGLYNFTIYDKNGNAMDKTLIQYGDKWIVRCNTDIVRTYGNFFYNSWNGPQITSISLPRTLVQIGNNLTLYGQENLQSIDGESPLIVDGHYLYRDMVSRVLMAAKSGEDVMTIPEGTTQLADYAISYNHVTKVIDLPSTITKIGGYCFEDSSAFNTLRMRMDEPPTAGTGIFNAVNQSGEIVVNKNHSTYNWSILFPKPRNFTFVNATE